MSEKDGGPAFPQHPDQDDVSNFGGITVRDYFAAAALQGLLANFNVKDEVQYAALAFKIADDAIRERAK